MNTLDSKDFGLKMYNRFPPKYIEDDASQSYALKRYLESLADGGFSHVISDTNNLLSLVNPNIIDANFLPILYKQFGLNVFNGIPEGYLRYLLPKLGDAWTQKGSIACVEFITSALSGVKVTTELTYDSRENPYITVYLEMDYSLGDYFPDVEHFVRLLETFLPFYVDKGIIYTYMFYDSRILRPIESQFFNVFDLKYDEGFMHPHKSLVAGKEVETDLLKDYIRYKHNVIGILKSEFSDPLTRTDYYSDIIGTKPKEDYGRFRPYESSYIFSLFHNNESSNIKNLDTQEKDKISSVCDIEAKILSAYGYFTPLLNTGKTLNNSFVLNTITENNDLKDVVEYSVVEDLCKMSYTDDEVVTKSLLVEQDEVAGIYSKGRKIEGNAVFAESYLGESVFAKYEDFADVTENKIIYGLLQEQVGLSCDEETTENRCIVPFKEQETLSCVIDSVEDIILQTHEQGSIEQTLISFTNTQSSLNGSFYTNTLSNICFDVITTSNGETTFVFN